MCTTNISQRSVNTLKNIESHRVSVTGAKIKGIPNVEAIQTSYYLTECSNIIKIAFLPQSLSPIESEIYKMSSDGYIDYIAVLSIILTQYINEFQSRSNELKRILDKSKRKFQVDTIYYCQSITTADLEHLLSEVKISLAGSLI